MSDEILKMSDQQLFQISIMRWLKLNLSSGMAR